MDFHQKWSETFTKDIKKTINQIIIEQKFKMQSPDFCKKVSRVNHQTNFCV